jgi:hypothetical protein
MHLFSSRQYGSVFASMARTWRYKAYATGGQRINVGNGLLKFHFIKKVSLIGELFATGAKFLDFA